MFKQLIFILLLAGSALGITLSGQLAPVETTHAALGNNIYVQLIDSVDAHVIATAYPSPFGYYSFTSVIADHNYFIVAYPGKVPEGWGIEFTPALIPVLTTLNNADNLNFVWGGYQICVPGPEQQCPF